MKNYEISNANYVLSQLIDEPLKGKFKFKVFNVKAELEKKVEVVTEKLNRITKRLKIGLNVSITTKLKIRMWK